MDSVNAIMEQFGWKRHTLEEIRSFVGNGIRLLMERSVPQGAENPRFEEAFEAFLAYYTEHCQIKTKPYDGILKLLGELSGEGFRLAIVSNKNNAAVQELKESWFAGYISAAVGDREGIRRKPAPDAVFQVLKELGSKPDEAVYVGDSEVDYETAKNSGLPCILVSWGFRDREDLERLPGAAVADSCQQLKELIVRAAEKKSQKNT